MDISEIHRRIIGDSSEIRENREGWGEGGAPVPSSGRDGKLSLMTGVLNSTDDSEYSLDSC